MIPTAGFGVADERPTCSRPLAAANLAMRDLLIRRALVARKLIRRALVARARAPTRRLAWLLRKAWPAPGSRKFGPPLSRNRSRGKTFPSRVLVTLRRCSSPARARPSHPDDARLSWQFGAFSFGLALVLLGLVGI